MTKGLCGWLALLLWAVPSTAVAQDRWRQIEDLPPSYVWDTRTARQQGAYILVWTLSPTFDEQRAFVRSQGAPWADRWVTSRERLMIDCRNLSYKYLELVWLADNGVPLDSSTHLPSEQQWASAGPETIMEAKIISICSYFGR